jgi:hypothetical protein
MEVVISGFCAECGKPIVLREPHLRKNVDVYVGPFGRVRQDLILCVPLLSEPILRPILRKRRMV